MNGPKRTKQRQTILNTVEGATGPLSAAQIHERAGLALPGLGLATVYRTLKLLLAAGQIVAVAFPGEDPHYEPAGRGHHHHFRCLGCKQWFELPRCLVSLPDGATLPEGFVIAAHHLTLYGDCPRCAAAS